MAGLYPNDHTVNIFGTDVVWPGLDPQTNKFTNGDFSNPLVKPSFIPAETINLIVDNLESFIQGLGLIPNNHDTDQLLKALQIKYGTTDSINDLYFPVGASYIQRLNDPTPLERGLPGTWELWNARADGYGLSSTALPGHTTYTPGANYAVNSWVKYHIAGDDYRLFKAKIAIANAPQFLDPVNWDPFMPGVIVERRKLQGWTDDDFTIGNMVSAGQYANWYVCEVIVPGGKFDSFSGGHRPPFVSGGIQGDRSRPIIGTVYQTNASAGGFADFSPGAIAGAFYNYQVPGGQGKYAAPSSTTTAGLGIDSGRIVPIGPDVAGINLSRIIWRRIS
jgi:hypothetical protein